MASLSLLTVVGYAWTLAACIALFPSPMPVDGQGCSSASNCSQCLDAGPRCGWCVDHAEKWEGRRCGTTLPGCTAIINPGSAKTIAPNSNEPFGSTVQVRPQRYSIKLRPGQSVELDVNVQPAPNYPLDVYYLMDHSASMKDDLNTLKNQSISIADAIAGVSSNYFIGYGSYVDKTTAPFALVQGDKVVDPCSGCKAPYSFVNTLPLTNDKVKFRQQVMKEKTSGNVDAPEGTLEAMMQVAVCRQHIGWRKRARHVLVVATDAEFHTAGDGRLAGIITPNDGKCHMSNGQRYTAGLEQDYPSVSFLNNKLQEEDVFPIFTVTNEKLPQYNALSSRIPGSSVVNMTSNSSGIVEILRKELARLVEEAKVTISPHEGVEVAVTVQCPIGSTKSPDIITGYQKCNGMKVNQQATFTVKLTGGECAALKNLKTITIRVVGFGDVVVDIEPLCECDCEKSPDQSADWCSKQGSDYCRVCKCDPGFRDDSARCDCNTNSTTPCLDPKSGGVCASRGNCECGRCECSLPEFTNQRIYGNFCECDNFTCAKDSRGRVCGGSQQGVCECGNCTCKENYYGQNCDCYGGNDTCIAKGEKKRICKGEGECECGKCKCYKCFSGEYCDLCTCTPEECRPLGVCGRSMACLSCPAVSDKERCQKCRGTRSIAPPTSLPHYIDGVEAKQCEATDEDGCDYYYWVAVNSQDQYSFYPLEIENKKSCPEAFNYLPLVLGIVFGLVLAGLILLLLWRLFAYYKDLQEYKRFLKSQNNQDWSKAQNPFYIRPTQKFNNPQYEGN